MKNMFGLKKKLQIKYRINTGLFLVTLFSLLSSISFSQVPYGLSSLPSARPTIFLDFDGQTIDNPYWRPFNGDSVIFCGPSQMTNGQMIRVFNQISEDYRPFNINITTDSSVYFAAPITRRTRVIFTPTYKWYGTAGGVAYIESFRWGLEVPCFVFDSLFNGNDKRIAEVGSHEAGHTLGLYHQSQYRNIGTDSCSFVTEYFSGRGTGDVGWAPIMGNSYFRNLTLWHVGLTLDCNSIQNDISIIANPLNGVTMRVDDYGNTTTNASQILNPTSFNLNGIINDSLDTDFFRLDLSIPGRLKINVNPYSPGLSLVSAGNLTGVINHSSNIDMELSLFRKTNLVSVYNPLTILDASLDTLLEPDTYYIRVNNRPNVNIFRSGMLGSYTITGSFGGSVVVPVQYIDFNGSNINDKHKLTWQIVSDEPIDIIKLEVSEDGLNFRELISLNGDTKEYEYTPFKNKNLYYRLIVKTKSQLSFTSRTIVIRNKSKFKIVSTTVKDEIIINTESHFDWALFDINGRRINNGKMLVGFNKISLNGLSGGIYILQVINENNNYSEKIIKL